MNDGGGSQISLTKLGEIETVSHVVFDLFITLTFIVSGCQFLLLICIWSRTKRDRAVRLLPRKIVGVFGSCHLRHVSFVIALEAKASIALHVVVEVLQQLLDVRSLGLVQKGLDLRLILGTLVLEKRDWA